MSLEKLGRIKIEVENELEKFFNYKIANSDNKFHKEALEFLKDFTLRGGKRIRSGMMVYGYGCFKEITPEIIKAAMAMELMQSYLLIHDDVIDKDKLRRGKDSLHVMYEKRYPVENKEHFGISMAICAGDLAACLMNEIFFDVGLKDNKRAVEIMNHVLENVVVGQMLDIAYEKKTFDELDEEKVLEVYRLKSASYTVEGPLHIGGALAGVDDARLKPLLDYGVALGKAFQIRDDINGIFGDEAKTGKPNDSDLKQGKRTLLVVKTLKECNDIEREFILSKIGNNPNDKDIKIIRELIRKYAQEYCESLCDKYVKDARNLIYDAELNEEGKSFLIDIADFVARRES